MTSIVDLTGIRGIQFAFVTSAGNKRITFDLYATANTGKTYQELEAQALSAMIRAGYDVESYTHSLIK